MSSSIVRLLSVFTIAALCLAAAQAQLANFADFQAAANQHQTVLKLVTYPTTPEEVKSIKVAVLKKADAALAALVAQQSAQLNFANTFAAIDALNGSIADTGAMLETVAQSSLSEAIRQSANEANVKLQEWNVSMTYREDLYLLLKSVADAKPTLEAEQQRLVDFIMRDYRRAGLALPVAERAAVEKLQKELAALTTEFSININNARAPLDFTATELAGVPQSFLDSPGVKQADGRYRVMANITWHAQAVSENAINPTTRQRLAFARNNLARDKNIPVLTKLVVLRAAIAQRLGYASWADYQIETRMAKNAATAIKFEEELVAGLDAKFAAELETLRLLKAADLKQSDAQLESWDIGYYTNKLLKDRFAVDTEALRVYFPYQATLEGMFAIYQKIFGLKFTAVEPP